MGRIPTPRALLLDHPVFPVAVSGPGGIRCDLEGSIAVRSLALADRRRVAVQLMAGVALAAEFDLWPGRAGIRGARARRGTGGSQAVFGAFPMPLAVVHARLGGGDAALESTREAAIEAVAEVSGLDADDLHPSNGLGFFLEGALRHSPVLQERPVDRCVARNLWAYQWDMPSLPDDDEIVFWKVSDPILARRYGGAMWAALQRSSRSAILSHSGASINADGSENVLVMVGRHTDEVLAGVDAWAGRQGRAAVVIGEFPPGWDPPSPPVRNPQADGRPLAVTGVPLDTALRVAEERRGRFDPWIEADRRALTEAACQLFERPAPVTSGTNTRAVDPVHRVLSLRSEGLDRQTLIELSGVDDATLVRKVSEGAVVVDGLRWRLPAAPRLRKDPFHAEIANSLSDDDPRKRLHQALAGEDGGSLVRWARSELESLRYESVREVLGQLEPGALGDEVDALRAESCLAGLDLSGARRVISGMSEAAGDPWRFWVELEDHEDHWNPPDLDLETLVVGYPRIAAELAVHSLRGMKKCEEQAAIDWKAILDQAIQSLEGLLANWFVILREAVLRPELFDDPGWIEGVAGDSRRLARLAAHKKALLLTGRGEWAEARNVLSGLAEVVRSPGRLGRIFIDLGNVSTDQTEETACFLRAHRHLEAAGFRYKTRNVVFNLAMIDIERLRLERAQARLKACARDNDPLHSIGEGLLRVARGQWKEFSAVIDELPAEVAESRVREGCHLLRGLAMMFDGRLGSARTHLESGGVDGLPWLRLLDAAEGRAGGVRPLEDPWGVIVAAGLVSDARDTGRCATVELDGKSDAKSAFAFALADVVLPSPGWLPGKDRETIATSLAAAGMEGWSERIRGQLRADFESFSGAAARLVEAGSLQAPAQGDWDAICTSLGLSGFEVRNETEGGVLWRWGDGKSSAGGRPGGISVIPLGGPPTSPGAWQLFENIVATKALSAVAIDGEDEYDTLGIVGAGESMKALRNALRRFAPSGLTVLLAGETGVGKGLAAEAIHQLSGRKGRLVTVNVAAVAGTLFEAELYGAAKGAFTGADRDRPGLAEEADGGTLFLDEIGDLDLSLQVKLLRFLDSGEVRRVGSGRIRNVDVRVIAASHRDLETMVDEGTFRQDLFYRMGSAKIVVPPLRERGADVLALKDLFSERAVRDQQLKPARWSREADAALLAHTWPGNVRELRRAVEMALVEADGAVINPEHLPAGIRTTNIRSIRRWEEAHRELRTELIRSSLERNDGNRAATARELGLSRQTLLYHMKQLGLK